jgi:mannose-6-phosphate isomerase-like protein (cupin superfamily)
MGARRVVTGHAPDGTSIVVSDAEVSAFPIGDKGSAATLLWGRDDSPTFPDDGSPGQMATSFPAPGGSAVAIMTLAPDGDDFHRFVADGLAPWADPDDPGMHRTATIDYDVVLEGVIGLELDNGVEVELHPGDLVVQNGTRHRWHNRGETVARMLSVTVGAYNEIEGGRPV